MAENALKVDDWVKITNKANSRFNRLGKVAAICIDDRGMLLCVAGDHIWVGARDVEKVDPTQRFEASFGHASQVKIHRGFCTVCNIQLEHGRPHEHPRWATAKESDHVNA